VHDQQKLYHPNPAAVIDQLEQQKSRWDSLEMNHGQKPAIPYSIGNPVDSEHGTILAAIATSKSIG
jgi:hypothetical protein